MTGRGTGRRHPILLATDLTSRCDRATDRAIMLARDWGVPLAILHVVERLPNERRWRREEMSRMILRDFVPHGAGNELDLEIVIEDGDVATAILAVAAAHDCGLIVTGTARHDGTMDSDLGSSVEKMMPVSPVPVLVVKRRPRHPYRHIVIGSDFSEPSARAAETASRMFPGTKTSVLNAVTGPGSAWIDSENTRKQVEQGQHELARAFEERLSSSGIVAGTREYFIEHGSPPDVLRDFIADREIDLAVFGTKGETGLRKAIVGSVAGKLMRCVSCDVLMVGTASSSGI